MHLKTSRSRRRRQQKFQYAKVWNLRIAWFTMLKYGYRLTKALVVLAIVAALGWGIKLGLDRTLLDNPDFRLQVVDLNPNQAMDENELVRLTGLDLNANLFRISVKDLTKRLALRPEVESVTVERNLPGTLVVRLTARTPQVWVACPDADLPAERKVGALLMDRNNIVYPCPARQFEIAAALPIVVLKAGSQSSIRIGSKLVHSELTHCRRLLAAALEAAPDSVPWIDTIQQAKEWSLLLTTTDGTAATFGLDDHARQVANLLAARAHSRNSGYAIATINLIPKENVPITVGSEPAPPRAVPVEEPSPADVSQERHARDLNSLINRD